MSGSYYWFLTCIKVSQEAGQVVWYSHLFKNVAQFIVIHIVKGFSVGNKAKVDVFLEFSCFSYDPTYVGRKQRGIEEPLDESERGVWKSWLKTQNIQKMKIMASDPITSWQIDGETVETVSDFILGSKITADGDCSHEIKRWLLLGKKKLWPI